ncbi:MAG: GNAT family N-acetyltransferase [Acidimicrobiales bacterium]
MEDEFEIRGAEADDLASMAALAANHQTDPARHCMYLGEDAHSIATDIAEVDAWPDFTAVASIDGRLVGWLLAEVDNDMGRVWWWGPYAPSDTWETVADQLYTTLRKRLAAAITEEEAAADSRSAWIEGWAGRHGFQLDPGSVLLRRQPTPVMIDARVRPLSPADHATVMALHEGAFPDTHLTPQGLVESDHPRLVIDDGDGVIGYVAYELQSDGSGYIDFLAVVADHRGDGHGRALVASAVGDLIDRGATSAHLTVRETNEAARALYASLAFVEERIARPYRKGFSLA